ncbi:TPA: class B sortase [Streptococcus suis]|nr:class B sortase [Streptococcus suis]HEM5996727.1 class B sortase [Streptococcus suis]HEM6089452.1 class B sortase [Streptococcus suis]HEM6265867.1 class B sortase [Streptococcus suis]
MKKIQNNKLILALLSLLAVVGIAIGGLFLLNGGSSSNVTSSKPTSAVQSSSSTGQTYQLSDEEKKSLTEQFDGLKAINSDTIAYVYAPGTKLDEPVVQTTDNSTYLSKLFDGSGEDPFMGTVFMDMDNKSDFSDQLTWLFGHARGSKVPDSRMFNDVNYYDDQTFFNEHPYVVIRTPEKIHYYQAAFMIIVHESTSFYRTSFDSSQQFVEQLSAVREGAVTKNDSVQISESDKYVVLSTCREDDVTIRANLYLREIPESELADFVAANKDKLNYVPTR